MTWDAPLLSLACPEGDAVRWLAETVLVNPVIVEKSAKTDVDEEGCLSFPGMNGDVSPRGVSVLCRRPGPD